jgi:DNA primase
MDSEVQQIKDRLSVNEVVGQYLQLKRAGKNYAAKCPFHKERTPSFHVSPERGTYMCFGCGEKGDIFSFVQKMEGIDFPTALKQLAERAGVTLTRRAPVSPERKEHAERLKDLCEAAVAFYEATLKSRPDVLQYLAARGLTDETTRMWRLGYAPAAWEPLTSHLATAGFTKDEIVEAGFGVRSEKRAGEVFDRFRGRIMFPIFDAGGTPVGVSGRFFELVAGQKTDTEPAKYVNSPETPLFKKSKILYGLERAKGPMRKADCILLVEGQFDLILAHQSGLPFAVALSGTALTVEHLSLLSRFSKRLVLSLDADAAGLRAGLKSARMALEAGFDVKIPVLPHGKDPADLARENAELLKAAVRTSQTAVEYFLNALWPTARDERSYKKLIEAQVLPLIAAMQSRIEQAHFVQVVSSRLGVPEAAVRAEVEKLVRAPRSAEPQPEVAEAPVSTEPELSLLERTAGMLHYYFEANAEVQARLAELLGQERHQALAAQLAPQAEVLRFRFEAEAGAGGDEQAVAADLLRQLELLLIDEEITAARGDAKKISELVRRKHGLLR